MFCQQKIYHFEVETKIIDLLISLKSEMTKYGSKVSNVLLAAISTTKRTMTVSQLNMSWTVAAAKARRNSFRSPIWVKETIVLVTEVPMLAPITIGMASETVRTTNKNVVIVGRGQSKRPLTSRSHHAHNDGSGR